MQPGFVYDKARYYINHRGIRLEVCIAECTQKYVTVTGNALTPGRDLEERGEQVKAVLEKYMVRPRVQKSTLPALVPLSGRNTGAADLDDLALIERARRSKNGASFSAPWTGDITRYKSASEMADGTGSENLKNAAEKTTNLQGRKCGNSPSPL